MSFSERVSERTSTVLKSLSGRSVSDKSISALNLQPPAGAELALNLLLHTFAFFTVLTLMYQFVISPMETNALAQQVDQAVNEAVGHALANVSPAQAQALKSTLPLLQQFAKLQSPQDPLRAAHNDSVMMTAYGVIMALGIAFVVASSVMAASQVRLGRTMGHVFAENAILFVVLAGLEGGFFLTVASKYVPVMPSVLATTTVNTLKTTFAEAGSGGSQNDKRFPGPFPFPFPFPLPLTPS